MASSDFDPAFHEDLERLFTSGREIKPELLESLTEELRLRVYLAAVRKDGFALAHVPEKLRTEEICRAAIFRPRSRIMFEAELLDYVPEELRLSVCLAGVQERGYVLYCLPEQLKTPEICLAAVQNDGLALQYVPEELKTEEICRAAVQQGGRALEYVPEHMKTPQLCWEALQQARLVFQYIPENLQEEMRNALPEKPQERSAQYVLKRLRK